jgi:DNA-binding transcriptional LysR family regulator
MEMQQVRYFLALSRTLNFTRAAEECNVSQPSLTRAIRMLEEEFGGELLRRERTQSHLTELGQRMLPLLRQCYESAQSAKSLARSIKTNEVAPLSLGLSRAIDMDLLTEPLRQLTRAYPGVRLRLMRGSPEEIKGHLKDGRIELAVAGPLGELWERLDVWILFEDIFELLLSPKHAMAPLDEITLDDLKSETILVHTACEMAQRCADLLGLSDEKQTRIHEIETLEDITRLLEANFGIALLPASGARSDRLRWKPVKDAVLKRSIAAYSVAGRRRSAAASTLLNLLRARDWTPFLNTRPSAPEAIPP